MNVGNNFRYKCKIDIQGLDIIYFDLPCYQILSGSLTAFFQIYFFYILINITANKMKMGMKNGRGGVVMSILNPQYRDLGLIFTCTRLIISHLASCNLLLCCSWKINFPFFVKVCVLVIKINMRMTEGCDGVTVSILYRQFTYMSSIPSCTDHVFVIHFHITACLANTDKFQIYVKKTEVADLSALPAIFKVELTNADCVLTIDTSRIPPSYSTWLFILIDKAVGWDQCKVSNK